ncbi:Transcriptional activator [Cladophialophora chaetospira]|uniref:Transcriptional activator n=1 Tax=Cladophialophora chaetospira TaxID=386627 RepID=A0AA38X1E2_9EURO|nr:Transcriptional activator [Cladophialophora chaetospira]
MQTTDTPTYGGMHPSYESSRRSALACNRCRGRKTKCSGSPPEPCPTCKDAGVECIYTESERRVSVPESYLQELQARARAADEFRSSQTSLATPSIIEEEPAKEDDDWWFKGMDTLLLTRSGERQYVGKGAAMYLAQKLSSTPETNLAWDVNPMYKTSLKRPASLALPQLPPYEFAKRLFAAQYIYIGTIFSFLQPHVFESRLQQIYSNTMNLNNHEDCLVFCQVLLIFAYGQMYSVNQWSGNEGPPGFTFFKHALWLLPDLYHEGSVLFVEVLGLLSPYMQNLNRKDAAFQYIGLALRMAISLGLHQEVDDPSMDLVEREHRRRVWWSVYSMDRIISVKSGNPITIHDEDIDVPWPSPIQGMDPDLSRPRVLAYYTQLSRILGRIGAEIYRKKVKSGSSLLSSVQSIMNDLANWLKGVPAELRIDFSALDRPISREAVSTFLHYYQCINMTARPLLLSVTQRRLQATATGTAPADWREGMSPSVVSVVDSAISAACASTILMAAAAKQGLYATYGFMDGEHAFSASLTLVMVNVAFPYNKRDAKAMETALSVLRGMAEKGNEYIQARLSLLMNLRATIGRRSPMARPQQADMGMVPLAQAPETDDFDLPPNLSFTTPLPLQDTSLELTSNFYPFQDVSLDFQIDDDPKFWEEIYGDIDIDMETGWIENALRNEVQQSQGPA